MRVIDASSLDLREFVRPGDTVTWGQASAEPTTLTEALAAQRADVGPVRCFLGLTSTGTFGVEHTDALSFVSYCGSGRNRQLAAHGRLEILPCRYSMLPSILSTGAIAVDVLFLLLPPPDRAGRYRIGLADEYLGPLVHSARTVIAEINDQVATTSSETLLDDDLIDAAIYTSRPVATSGFAPPDDDERAVAKNVADLIEDGSTIQIGLGSIPAAVVEMLTGHADLSVHTGMAVDAVVDLVTRGAVNGRYRADGAAEVVTGALFGTDRMFRFADHNPAVSLRSTRYTHSPDVLAGLHRFTSINSALEVDLTGQVNAEAVAGRYLGAVGGAPDFALGAQRAGGLAITALASRHRSASRIVPRLEGTVTVPRSDAGIVVTEFGVADLRGRTLDQRAELMVSIAHPSHRDALAAAYRDLR